LTTPTHYYALSLHDALPISLNFDEGITGWAARRREAALVNQAHLDPRVRVVPGTPNDPEALISIPLIARAQLKGVLNIYRVGEEDRKSTRLNSSHDQISYAV